MGLSVFTLNNRLESGAGLVEVAADIAARLLQPAHDSHGDDDGDDHMFDGCTARRSHRNTGIRGLVFIQRISCKLIG
jgi:hypothetical protein